MFNLRKFIMNGLTNAVGKMADYQVILNAAAWMEKGVLVEADLAELQVLIESQSKVEEPTEELVGE